MANNLTTAQIIAQQQKLARQQKQQAIDLSSGANHFTHTGVMPTAPPGWTQARFEAAVRQYIKAVEAGHEV